MDSKTTDLLEKYWGTETSVEEEQTLKTLLKEAPDGEMPEAKALFDYFESEAKCKLDADFDKSVLRMIEQTDKEVKVISFSGYLRKHAGIAAAAVVILVSSYLFTQQRTQTTRDTFDTSGQVYIAMKKQLLKVFAYLHKGSLAINELANLTKVETQLWDFVKIGIASEGLELLSEMNNVE